MAASSSSKSSSSDRSAAHILWFKEVRNTDVGLVGGKNASLGEMYQLLTPQGVRIPNGFAVTARAYFDFVEAAGLEAPLRAALDGLDKSDTRALERAGQKCRQLLMAAPLPAALVEEITAAYAELSAQYDAAGAEGAADSGGVDVAVRSSATAEDLPDASFAGQQESYLNVHGPESLLIACRRCIASLFTNRAISYRIDKGFDHFDVGLSIGVQKMVRSDKASSGVMFTLDTETGFKDVCLVTGAWGLGENVVQGAVNPDEFLVHKPALDRGYAPLVGKRMGSKELTMVYATGGTVPVKNTHTPRENRERFCVSDAEVLDLARWGVVIERHYKRPMDIEWAKDGLTGDLFIVQARPETVHSQADTLTLTQFAIAPAVEKVTPKVTGTSVGAAIGQGVAHVIRDVQGIHSFRPGEVLVTEMTDPDWEPILKRAAAVVTNRGGRTCHAAIISRELGIPCVVGCGDATALLETGEDVTVDCSRGDVGRVLPGLQPFERTSIPVSDVPRPKRSKLALNLADPERAFAASFLPQDGGVGLARMEFIINNSIRAHPLALLNPQDARVAPEDRLRLAELTRGYSDGRTFFVDRLAQGVGTICAAFYPRRVILRFSDFKTDEYANLLGGRGFEPEEDNPMIGWRGASRYYDPKYKPAFHLECEAVRRVREEFGLTNLAVMVPFCRTVKEARAVIDAMAEVGLKRPAPTDDDAGAAGAAAAAAAGAGSPSPARPAAAADMTAPPEDESLKVMGMCEIPANVILADAFLDVFDGFSIGSNDLTQLALGVDRNSEVVAHVFDESNEAVKALITQVADACKRRGRYIGICGQAPSDDPSFAEFVLRCGLSTISLTPDSLIATAQSLARVEAQMEKEEQQQQ